VGESFRCDTVEEQKSIKTHDVHESAHALSQYPADTPASSRF
jgi:hypothetical protein